MSPIQQMLLGAGVVTKKTYIDDVFSTYLWEGTGSARSINNGIDTSGEGSLVWVKKRNDSGYHTLYDTDRGVHKPLYSNLANSEANFNTTLTAFNNNGFSLGDSAFVNASNITYTSWTFRKAPGFFTICEWTGNATNRLISHDLGCVPGLILIKRTDVATDWMVYHRSLNGSNTPSANRLHLNTTVGEAAASTVFNSTEPTSTTFGLGTHYDVNGNNGTFIAYLFAGGEANLASVSGARCVVFDGGSDGNGDYLQLASTADLSPGSGDFTFEAWIKPDTWRSGYYDSIWTTYQSGTNSGLMITSNGSNFVVREAGVTNHLSIDLPPLGQWTHVAVTRSSSTLRIFINGTLKASASNSTNFATAITSIASDGSGADFKGSISNLRFVKGTAVYTSSFRPPTAPLTNITNTKLLCCNHENRDGSTVTPGTITAEGNPVARYFSPFDDPAGFVFGDNEEGIVKVGSYIGNGSTTGPEVFLGHEPQWLMIKRIDTSETWDIYDSMRGIVSGDNDQTLRPDSSASEYGYDRLSLTPTGFQAMNDNNHTNADGGTYIYLSIRRPDGYVGKPADAGTDVFSLGTRSGSSSDALACVNTLVDFSLIKNYGAGEYWAVNARLMGKYTLKANATNANLTGALPTTKQWDNMLGHMVAASNGATNSPTGNMVDYGWKRHAGFTICTWVGDGSNRTIPHDLSKTPEMIWIKNRGSTNHWIIGHKGLNGGTNPWEKYLRFTTESEFDFDMFQDLAPTSTHFAIKANDHVNENTQPFIAMLFASVDGISKVGYYDGQQTELTITTGFAPRFLIVRRINGADNWWVFDTTRGWASGNNSKLLQLDSSSSESTQDFGAPTSTGFTLVGDSTRTNAVGNDYIYYCHA